MGKQPPPCNRVPLAPLQAKGGVVGGKVRYPPPVPPSLPSSAAAGADLPRVSGGAGAVAVPPTPGEGRGSGKGAASPHRLQGAAWLLEGVRDPAHARHKSPRQRRETNLSAAERPRSERPGACRAVVLPPRRGPMDLGQRGKPRGWRQAGTGCGGEPPGLGVFLPSQGQ